MLKLKIFVAIILLSQLNCGTKSSIEENTSSLALEKEEVEEKKIQVGAAHLDKYLPLIKDKTIALVVNQTSEIQGTHLIDTLLNHNVKIEVIYSPEHGFRGTADAGEKISDGKDPATGIKLASLYGKKRKPDADDLKKVEMVIFDIQDVGARFYTYISTMHYVMEACAENEIPFIVLDRPNPNGHYVDGPLRKEAYQSFVGMHEIPIVHGMTVGELAQMINGEGWLTDGKKAELTVIPCGNYDHNTFYELPVKPSPNLPNIRSIYLYPYLCLFEGTTASIGRGTDKQFQLVGSPDHPEGDYMFTPVPMPGANNPKHKGVMCQGYDLTEISLQTLKNKRALDLSYLLDFYSKAPDKNAFFLQSNFFDKLAGGEELRKQIQAGKTEAQIKASWKDDLDEFKLIRKKYLLYADFH